MLGAQPCLRLVLLDRHRARFFDLHLDELKEAESLVRPLPRRGRGDGFAGVDAGHAERSVNDEVLHHFKNVADSLKQGLERGAFDQLAVGSHDNHYSDFESQLHPYVKKRLLGHFAAEVGGATEQQVRRDLHTSNKVCTLPSSSSTSTAYLLRAFFCPGSNMTVILALEPDANQTDSWQTDSTSRGRCSGHRLAPLRAGARGRSRSAPVAA